MHFPARCKFIFDALNAMGVGEFCCRDFPQTFDHKSGAE